MTIYPPTRQQHLDNCTRISIALTEYIRELHEIAKFQTDNWTPNPYNDDAYNEWAART